MNIVGVVLSHAKVLGEKKVDISLKSSLVNLKTTTSWVGKP